ncbi:MAG: ADOP family duplicated permease [Bryobacteraceae bacterium]
MSLISRFVSVFRTEHLNREIEDEQEFHITCRTEEFVEAGMEPEAAARRARLEFGNRSRAHAESHDAKLLVWLESAGQDFRYGARTLLQSPSFAAVAVLTLALGVGANTATFSVVNSVLLSPLPYRDSNRLICLFEEIPSSKRSSISYPNFIDWRNMNRSFSSIAGYHGIDVNISSNGEAEHLPGEMISAGLFETLGINPILGRTFSKDDDRLGAEPTIMISEGLWKRKFGSMPNIVGQPLAVNGTPRTIIGIVPSKFHFPEATSITDVYEPMGNWNEPRFYANRSAGSVWFAVGRLKPRVTLEAARADMQRVSHRLAMNYPAVNSSVKANLVPLKEVLVGDMRLALLVLQGAVLFVLLIACVNVANLLLARSTSREREFAIRLAVGAGKIRIVRQLLTESILLALVGGALGLLVAKFGIAAALTVLPQTVLRPDEVGLNLPVLLFTFSVSLVAGVLFGVAPAFKTRLAEIGGALKESGRTMAGSRHSNRGVFVVLEMAMALVLLIGAGLMIRTLFALWGVDPGFNPHRVMTFSVSPRASLLKEKPAAIRSFLRQMHGKIASIPGVAAVSLGGYASPMNGDQEWYFWFVGKPKPAHVNDLPMALTYIVEPDYLNALQLHLKRGRFLRNTDNELSTKVVVIDETMAEKYFPGQDPIGQYLDFDTDPQNPGRILNPQIVGVVGHVNQWGLASDASNPLRAQMYLSITQIPDKEMSGFEEIRVYVRTKRFDITFESLRHQLLTLDQGLVIFDNHSMEQIVSRSIASKRFTMALLVAFAGIALVLASIGIYGVLAHLVGQRRQEIGIRMALGAAPSEVLRMILADGGRMILAGIGVGVIVALALTHLMSSMLFGVKPTDLPTFVLVILALCSVAFLACYAPARSAMKLDPMIALRNK